MVNESDLKAESYRQVTGKLTIKRQLLIRSVKMTEQLSLLDMLDLDTDMMPIEEQLEGRKGWIIECTGICLKKNGFKEDHVRVATRQIVFEKSTATNKVHKVDGDEIWQQAKSVHGPYIGWMGSVRPIYKSRPSMRECEKWALENLSECKKDGIRKIEYGERDGNWNWINRWEDGWKGR